MTKVIQAMPNNNPSHWNTCDVIDREDTLDEIEELPPVTPQSCEDCISRQYLLDNCVVDKITMPYVPVSKIESAPPVASQPCGDYVSRQAVEDAVYDASRAMDLNYEQMVGYINKVPPAGPQPKMRKCKWVKYDHRTICPKEHDVDEPYWRIPESRKDALKYCPFCGLEIAIEGE